MFNNNEYFPNLEQVIEEYHKLYQQTEKRVEELYKILSPIRDLKIENEELKILIPYYNKYHASPSLESLDIDGVYVDFYYRDYSHHLSISFEKLTLEYLEHVRELVNIVLEEENKIKELYQEQKLQKQKENELKQLEELAQKYNKQLKDNHENSRNN